MLSKNHHGVLKDKRESCTLSCKSRSAEHACGFVVQVMVGLESAEAGAYQKRVGQMRLLGELYNYRVVDSR